MGMVNLQTMFMIAERILGGMHSFGNDWTKVALAKYGQYFLCIMMTSNMQFLGTELSKEVEDERRLAD